jgi:ATP-binding cassette, subfamily B, bacterial
MASTMADSEHPSIARSGGLIRYVPRTWRYVRPHWRLASCSLILIVASSLVGLLTPWPLAFLVDTVLTEGGFEHNPVPQWLAWPLGGYAQSPVALIILAVAAGLLITALHRGLDVLDSYVHTRLDLKIALAFRGDLFRHAESLPLTYHDQRQSGMMIYAVNTQGESVARLVMVVPGLMHSALTLIGMVWISMTIDWQLALLSLTVVPFLYYSVGYYMRNIQDRMYQVKTMEGQSLSIIHEAISMIRVIIAFGREDHEHQRFRRQGAEAMDARVRLTMRQTLFSLAVDSITALGTAVVLGFGAYHVLQRRLTVGELLVIMAYIASVYRPLEAISTTVGSLQDISTSLKFAFDILDTEPAIKDAPGAVAIERSRGDVAFEDVGFSYAGRVDTLRNVSFRAQAGQVVAIVGPTGAGKTTLISLLPRFYEAQTGRVVLDGVDVRQLTLRSLREQISVVLQEPLLFSGPIRENICYGRLDATQEEIVEAAKAANAHDFIMKLPQQYETELGERGAKLSGGERQRIAVARAFLKNAPILVLDEPTSSIDSKTEAVILDALDRLMVGRTTFMIAHRLSTIRRADTILVLDQGRLIEQGPHQELVQRGGLYQRLYEMQTQHRGRQHLPEDHE